jgi:hypothetical protein
MASNPSPTRHKEFIWRHYKWTWLPYGVKHLRGQNVLKINGASILSWLTQKKFFVNWSTCKTILCPQLSHNGFAFKKCQNK